MTTDYIPDPIDTSDIELSEELRLLVEILAENAHDQWAEKRYSEGWSWGRHRCDMKKHHPDLVPYDCLSDSEKEYDRLTAMGTIKAIVALGFRIEKEGKQTGLKRVADGHPPIANSIVRG